MKKSIHIAGTEISSRKPPFIIAEMSGNHNQSLDTALEIVNAASLAGVNALKIQTYTAETMTLDLSANEFFIDNLELWKGKSLYELYNDAHTPWEWHEQIFDRCKELGLICFSTPFDITAVEFLESLDVPCYKIASFENTDIPLIRKIASTGKPMIISTGMASLSELDETIKEAKNWGCSDIVLLKCTSTYPASPQDTNICTIPHMADLFDTLVGLSDHTMGTGVAIAATAFGATVIEKHFTLSRADGGVDSAFSLEPNEMKSLVTETKRAWESCGKITYGPTEKEMASLRYRRSLYVTKNIKAGEIFSADNIRSIRPGLGLPPKYLDVVLNKKAKQDIMRGTPLGWDLLL